MLRLHRVPVAIALASVLFATTVSQAQPPVIPSGQTDTFTSGSLNNWTQGKGPVGLAPISSGGPAGAGDGYLQMTSTGPDVGGAGSRLIAFNATQWTGDYSGIETISIDFRAPTDSKTSQLNMRVALASGPNGQGYVSSSAFTVANDGEWHRATFTLSAGAMTAVGNPGAFNTFASNVPMLMILSSSPPSLLGDSIDAVVGIDNITAVGGAPIPEPAGVLLVAFAGFAIARPFVRGRRRAPAAP